MTAPKTLRVRARRMGVQNFERLEAAVNPTNCFVGYRHEPDPERPGGFRFTPTNEVEELPFRAEYIQALHNGDLEAADAETAKAAGLNTTPSRSRAESGDE